MNPKPNNLNFMQPGKQQTFAYQLRDIHGLDPIPWWPPALGWWLVTAWLLISVWLVRRYIPKIHSKMLTDLAWRWDAARQLRNLRLRAQRQPTYITAKELSELLRRIAMARYGRQTCAGLSGYAWLEWLTQHDPAGYVWKIEGKILLTAPYAPPNQASADIQHLFELLDATKSWLQPIPPHKELHSNV